MLCRGRPQPRRREEFPKFYSERFLWIGHFRRLYPDFDRKRFHKMHTEMLCVLLTALQAIERDETIRETEYAALAEIPRKLEFINNLTDCVRESIGLYQAEDAVLVALFSALTGIIHELTRSKGSK